MKESTSKEKGSHKKTIKRGTEKKKHLSKTQRHKKARKIKFNIVKSLTENEKLISKSKSEKGDTERLSTTPSQKMSDNTRKKTPSQKRLNEDLIEMLDEMIDILSKQGEHFRAGRYKAAQESIMEFPNDITDIDQLKGKKGIGPTILKKLEEFQKTGKVEFIEREKKNPALLLTNVYGVGYKGATKLVNKGITTIAQLKKQEKTVLNDTQRKGLKHYNDIMKRIPRSEIEEYEKVLREVFDEVKQNDPEYSGAEFEIVGSYRRGKSDSGDIDIIITDSNGNREIFKDFLDKLIDKKMLLEILSRGKVKSLTIGKLDDDHPARRLDFLYSPPDEYAFAILYFTGSKYFNTFMRRRALEIGYSLNEHGFYKMIDG